MAAVEDRTLGEVTIGPGTWYESTHRHLERGGLKEEPNGVENAPSSGGPPRRFYALTAPGGEAARQELVRLAELVKTGQGTCLLEEAS